VRDENRLLKERDGPFSQKKKKNGLPGSQKGGELSKEKKMGKRNEAVIKRPLGKIRRGRGRAFMQKGTV